MAWREAAIPNRGRFRLLEFTGFSTPARAGGLNRLGFIRELSRTAETGATESLYFCLMTASPEETAEAARKALHSAAKEATYTAIDGRLADGGVETVVAPFTAPAQWSVANRNELIGLARMALSAATPRPPDFPTRSTEMRPFLHALAETLHQPGPAETRFAYAGRLYHLWLEKSADSKATASFQKRGLIPANSNAVRATGRLRREAGGKESTFRLWIEEGAPRPLPLRIEYQAKSYLRLIFEADS